MPGQEGIEKLYNNCLGAKSQVAALVICAGVLFGEARSAEQISVIEAGRFSTASAGLALPDGWKPLTFKKIPQHTAYEVVVDGGIAVVKATSHASASGLINSVSVDPKEYPFMRWRWKIDHVLGNSDVHLKEGDDYPARLYVTFEYDPDKVGLARKLKYKAGKVIFGDIPIAALNYIWDTKSTVGTMVDNAYTDFAKMIVVESGSLKTGKWVEEERNVLEDYQLAFGGDPPKINGVAIMTDTDNTREEATAYYGDISFAKAKKSSADSAN
ncbi:DUF3047 domain-containing protein [Nitrospira sp. KM1]|uniref:DUF3047 domain-containing protein n=1 Tax=Nitrospira sp. KM1 TaxID=1936990 RepID=UPI001E32ED8C|nr:DUF3047 domain-containing protein [Nitrospira sp. KM1]